MKRKITSLMLAISVTIGLLQGMLAVPVLAAVPYYFTNGVYNIIAGVGSNMAIDVNGAGTRNGTNIQIWSLTDELQQQFRIERVSGSYYRIVDQNSNKVLDVAGGSRASGTNVHLYEYNGTDAQMWMFEDAGMGYYFIKSKLGCYLDVSGAGTACGTNVQVYTLNRSNAQRFKFRSTTPYKYITSQTYTILSALNTKKAVDAAGGGTGNCTNIQLWDSNGTNAQKFNIQIYGQGYFKIAAVNGGRVLDVSGGQRKSGVNVQLYDFNKSDAQLWRFYDAGSGYFYIKNKLGYYLDVAGGATANGTNIWVYSGNKTNAQKFKLTATTGSNNNNGGNKNASYETYYVTANSGLILRAGRGTNYSKILTIPNGSAVSVESGSISGGWAKVKYNGKEGYCSTTYLSKENNNNNGGNNNVNSYGYAQPISIKGAAWSSSTANNAGCKHDIQASNINGTPVYAIQDGTIRCVQKVGTSGSYKDKLVSYGNIIEFTSSDGKTTAKYAHLKGFAKCNATYTASAGYPSSVTNVGSNNIKTVNCGSFKVKRGDLIGYVGTTGNSTGPHLHFELRINGKRVSPDQYVSIN